MNEIHALHGAPKSRCTFAIISHPDAGKTTMTEKILWFGSVIRQAGMVKSKHGNFAKSDWMELEKERGISVSSSVLSFDYMERALHLLDTPGHKDFSEDTYRTLTAVESCMMMIDSAKGVEAQTIKLMDVCRMRATPIVTFMNKYDRDALDPYALLENVETILHIHCTPMTWPIGDGVDFKGVYDIVHKQIYMFDEETDPRTPHILAAHNLDAPEVVAYVGDTLLTKLKHDLEMVSELLPPFDRGDFLAGMLTPVFFGSALHNFGVKEVIDFITDFCPGPKPRMASLFPYTPEAPTKEISPEDPTFSGFVFKIQANMDKRHRDRVAFLRVISGRFKRGQRIFNTREQKEVKISTPLIFQARDLEITEEAFPGDIIGLTGRYAIGDTFTEGELLKFSGIPSFAPEIFVKVNLKDPMKAKQLEKGLRQLAEEGTVQLFTRHTFNEKILGAVGMLQFEVVKYRLEDEYNVLGEYTPYPFIGMRWVKFTDEKQQDKFIESNSNNIVYDLKGRPCFAVRSEWDLKLVQDKNPDVQFFKNSDYL